MSLALQKQSKLSNVLLHSISNFLIIATMNSANTQSTLSLTTAKTQSAVTFTGQKSTVVVSPSLNVVVTRNSAQPTATIMATESLNAIPSFGATLVTRSSKIANQSRTVSLVNQSRTVSLVNYSRTVSLVNQSRTFTSSISVNIQPNNSQQACTNGQCQEDESYRLYLMIALLIALLLLIVFVLYVLPSICQRKAQPELEMQEKFTKNPLALYQVDRESIELNVIFSNETETENDLTSASENSVTWSSHYSIEEFKSTLSISKAPSEFDDNLSENSYQEIEPGLESYDFRSIDSR